MSVAAAVMTEAPPTKMLQPFNPTLSNCARAFEQMSAQPFGIDDHVLEQGPKGIMAAASLPSAFFFDVLNPKTGEAGGLLGAMNVVPQRGADAQISLWDWRLMGAKMDRQVGLLALLFGFELFGLERFNAWIAAPNWTARRYAERIGFSQEGRMSKAFKHQGVLMDGIMYGILRDEAYRMAIE